MQTITIVIEGGMVQSVYASGSNVRVIVLDLDIQGSDFDDPSIYFNHASVMEPPIECYATMPYEDGKALQKYILDN